ncbi:PIR Superfamily Protein [Plasmodium ovale wallikeri]|uniref:PIR Superfamily Protein n=2 Tax=Plasmodium ovale TaxID=36330 RepID=A0A1A9ARW5_PLAOA|nr:PIR Superfamily Protein [Plasmodium ovale wallikeri]SBT58908.1 PIR Superfamily Protein [Plasmodium ovale wallikeri]SBT73345.1 Plasmodium vivax Vir protein, putative [Plasmodium ovale]
MQGHLGKDDLPSIKYYNILKNILQYDMIDEYIGSKKLQEVYTWSVNLINTLNSYLDQYISYGSIENYEKRCIDVIYILDLIIHKIKNSPGYDVDNLIEKNIDNIINTSLMYNNCDIDSRRSDEEHISVMNNRKEIYDLCEDVTYIGKSTHQINISTECQKIKDYIEEKMRQLKIIYEASYSTYSDILIYNKFYNFDLIKSTIDKIKCNSKENSYAAEAQNALGGDTKFSTSHAITSVSISLIGFVLIPFLLYRLTPLKPWLHKMILRKTHIMDNLNEVKEDFSENMSQYMEKNLSNRDLHVLYEHSSYS